MKLRTFIILVLLTVGGLVITLCRETIIVKDFPCPINVSGLSVETIHDSDGWVTLAFRQQRITVVYTDGEKQLIKLDKPDYSQMVKYLKRSIDLKRIPFVARILYEDFSYGYPPKLYSVKNKPIKRIELSLININDIKIWDGENDNNFFLWYRPKFHHDSNLTVAGIKEIFNENINQRIFSYLKIITSWFLKIIFGTEILLIILVVINRIIPKMSFITENLSRQIEKTKWLGLTIILLIFGVVVFMVSKNILQNFPHTQDEVVYLFQSKIFSQGKLYAKSLPGEKARFFDHEFVINNGKWFGAFPPGTSLAMIPGILLNHPEWINPIISAINIVLLFILVRILFGTGMALLSASFLLISPFFVLISASYFSHPLALGCSLCSLIAMMIIKKNPRVIRYWVILAMALGVLSLTRPANALMLAILILLNLFFEVIKTHKGVFYFTALMFLFLLINLGYNYLLTGSWRLFPHNLYCPFDKLGWGLRGVEWGSGFGLKESLVNLTTDLYSLGDMSFFFPGVFGLTLVPLAFWSRHKKAVRKMAILWLVQVTVYFFYFNDGAFYGPRLWFEVFWIIPVFCTIGLQALREKFKIHRMTIVLVYIFFVVYGAKSLLSVLPNFIGVNGMAPPKLPELNKKSVVFVDGRNAWMKYGQYFTFINPNLEANQIIYARDRGVHNVASNKQPLDNRLLKEEFPDRDFYLLENEQLTRID